MRRRSTYLLLLVAFLAAGFVCAQSYWYQGTISASQVNTAVSFTDNTSGGTNAPFKASVVQVYNAGPSTVYIDLRDTTATTADIAVKSGFGIAIPYHSDRPQDTGGFSGMGLICAGGEVATVYVTAYR